MNIASLFQSIDWLIDSFIDWFIDSLVFNAVSTLSRLFNAIIPIRDLHLLMNKHIDQPFLKSPCLFPTIPEYHFINGSHAVLQPVFCTNNPYTVLRCIYKRTFFFTSNRKNTDFQISFHKDKWNIAVPTVILKKIISEYKR